MIGRVMERMNQVLSIGTQKLIYVEITSTCGRRSLDHQTTSLNRATTTQGECSSQLPVILRPLEEFARFAALAPPRLSDEEKKFEFRQGAAQRRARRSRP
jgi:hypothetical protein